MNHFDSEYLNSLVPPSISVEFEGDTTDESQRKERKNGFKYKEASEEELEKMFNQIQSKKVDKTNKSNDKTEIKVAHCVVHGRKNIEHYPELLQQEQGDVIQGKNTSKLLSVIAEDNIQHYEALENIEELQGDNSHYIPIVRHNSCRSSIGAPTLETIQEEATLSFSESDVQSDISDAKFANEDGNQKTGTLNNSSTLIVPKLDLEGLNDSHSDEHSPTTVTKLTNISKINNNIQEKKLVDLRKRIDALLENILKETTRVPEHDGVYDLLRRHKREAEFASRFSRNHLYQLQREVLELNKQMKDPSIHMHSHIKNIQRKIITTHQHSLQALEVYHNQMPMLTHGGSLGKLAELVSYLTELTKLCNALKMKCVTVPGAPCFEEKARHLQKLLSNIVTERSLGTQKESGKKVESMTNVMVASGRKAWENSQRSTNNSRVNKLAHSAYACSPHRQNKVNKHKDRGKQIAGRKKTMSLTAKLAKLSLQTQLRNQAQKNMLSSPYAQSCGLPLLASHPLRTTTKEQKPHSSELSHIKHESQPTEPSLDQHPSSSSSLQPPKHKMRKLNTYEVVNKVDENIETMVSSISCDENQEETIKTKPVKQDENLKMSCGAPEDAFLRNLSDKIIEMCEERVREKIDVLVSDLVAEKKAQIKDRENVLQASTQAKEAATRAHEISSSEGELKSAVHIDHNAGAKILAGSKSERSLPGSKCFRMGSKNAQLICIEHSDQIDINPLASGDAGIKQQHIHHQHLQHSEDPKPDLLLRKLAPEVEQLGPTSDNVSAGPRMSGYACTWSPEVRSSFVKLFISKEEEAQVLKYRKKFQTYMKNDPMYQGSKEPWVMVEKLSDQLVTEVMQCLVEEVQMQFLADELYDLEFEQKKRSKHKS